MQTPTPECFVSDAKLVGSYCTKVTPASLLIVMCETL
jgi:hypothetical protein